MWRRLFRKHDAESSLTFSDLSDDAMAMLRRLSDSHHELRDEVAEIRAAKDECEARASELFEKIVELERRLAAIEGT